MDYLWYFLFYSLCGFGLEVAFARITRAEKQDRKCQLFLPLCPVYGLGAVGILLLPRWILERPLLLAAGAVVVSTAVEYGMSVFYEKMWRVSFWDYSGLPLNIHGRVCLPFSVAWGALALPLVYWIQPAVTAVAAMLPDMLLLPIFLLVGVDTALTGQLLRSQHTTDALMWYKSSGGN